MPPRLQHYVDLTLVDDEDDPDPELTALLHEKVVQVKQEINWDKEEQQYLEKIRQKAHSHDCSDGSDSDLGEAAVSANAPLCRKKCSNREGLLDSETLGETEFEGERIAIMSVLEVNTPDRTTAATSPYCPLLNDAPQLAKNSDRECSSPEVTTGERVTGMPASSCVTVVQPLSYVERSHDLKGADTPWQTSHPTACISECYDPQSGYETENEHEQTCSDVETDSYEQEINLKRSVMPLTNSDARMPLMNSDSCDPEMSVITQNNFPESDPEKTKKNEYSLGQVVFKKVIKLKIPKLPISTSICEEHERSHTSYSQTEFDYEQQCAMYHVMDHVHWKSLPTNSNPLVSSPLQPVAFQSIRTVSHCSYGDCSCNCSFSQPIISHCHHPSQHEGGNIFTNHVNVNPYYPSSTCTCCTRSGAMLQHLTPSLCHQPCHSSPCDLQPLAPSPPNYYYHCCSASSDISISLPKSSKRPLELDECDSTDSTVANGPQSKRLCSIVDVRNFHA